MALTRAELAAELAKARAEIDDLRAADPAQADQLAALGDALERIEAGLAAVLPAEITHPVRSFVVTNKPFHSAWGVHAPGDVIYEHMLADKAGIGISRLIRLERLAEAAVVDASQVPAEFGYEALEAKLKGQPTAAPAGPTLAEVTAAAAVADAAAGGADYHDGTKAPGQPDGFDGTAATATGVVTLTGTGSTTPGEAGSGSSEPVEEPEASDASPAPADGAQGESGASE